MGITVTFSESHSCKRGISVDCRLHKFRTLTSWNNTRTTVEPCFVSYPPFSRCFPSRQKIQVSFEEGFWKIAIGRYDGKATSFVHCLTACSPIVHEAKNSFARIAVAQSERVLFANSRKLNALNNKKLWFIWIWLFKLPLQCFRWLVVSNG